MKFFEKLEVVKKNRDKIYDAFIHHVKKDYKILKNKFEFYKLFFELMLEDEMLKDKRYISKFEEALNEKKFMDMIDWKKAKEIGVVAESNNRFYWSKTGEIDKTEILNELNLINKETRVQFENLD